MWRHVAVGAVWCVLASCARPATPPARAEYDVITEDQIEKSQAINAYEVIQRLKPNFLASRGPTNFRDASPTLPKVYVNDVLYGDVSTLTTIEATDIAMIRMYQAWEATYKFGTGNMGGAIDVFTKQ